MYGNILGTITEILSKQILKINQLRNNYVPRYVAFKNAVNAYQQPLF